MTDFIKTECLGRHMKIEIGKLSPGLIVTEYIVRGLPEPSENDRDRTAPHLQAQIQHKRGKQSSPLLCDITYFSAEKEFLGQDYLDTRYSAKWGDDFFPLDMQLHIPEGAATARLTISMDRGKRFWELAGKLATVLLIVLIVVWIVKLILQAIAAW